ncbi:hypothetical protein BVAD3_39910 (plasmid) [Bacillus velezensis]|nr:hypothetical protein BVAD3_39910 [Bacillus velezensis]
MIDSVDKLKVHLKILKKKLLHEGADKLELYPMFCLYYDKNKERYQLPKVQVLDVACEILIEEV